ncbi:MAG: hypothetical protein JKY91_01245 [Emcibacter sp.]|nr:hypothetical protein [Emcibacter sp.]
MTKLFLSLLFIFLAGGHLFAQVPQPSLLSDLDIPLMTGFQEEEDSRVVFDTPDGRIIEVRAAGFSDAKAVFDYYQIVLPSLAWRNVAAPTDACGGGTEFCIMARRDGEILRLNVTEIKQSPQKTIIYFSVNPE